MNAWLAKPIPKVWFIRSPVCDPAQTLAAARGIASRAGSRGDRPQFL